MNPIGALAARPFCEGWNGTKDNKFGWERAVVDVYVYKIYVKELSGQTHVYYGHVTLVK